MKKEKYNIAIVGATGLVGSTMLKLIDELNIELDELRLFASKKSIGKKVGYKNVIYEIDTLHDGCFENLDFVLFATDKEVSKKYVKDALKSGAIVIDNSSAFRLNQEAKLIVPEINFESIGNSKLICVPNCATIQSVMALNCLMEKYTLKRVIYSTYQSVSGSGIKGLFDLSSALDGYPRELYSYDISKTCIPLIGNLNVNCYSDEEEKMINETKKILNMPFLEIDAMCVRVPIPYGHGVSINVEVAEEVNMDEISSCFKDKLGIRFYEKEAPIPEDIENNNDVHIGRLKVNQNNKHLLSFYCVANNIRKGAALNAIQILKKLINEE